MGKKNVVAGKNKGNGANLGFEAKLWLAADELRSNVGAAEYKNIVLGLIFLKHISDSFEEMHPQLGEDADEYRAKNVFWVPKKARWAHLQERAKQPTIGKIVDEAMAAIERDNPRLEGLSCVDYARPSLDYRLGDLIDLIGTINSGDAENRSDGVFGRVYEYILSQFASKDWSSQHYAPRCIVCALVEMLGPCKGRVFDPCCGSGGMLVESAKFVEFHGGRISDIAIYGQEVVPMVRRLATMNLAVHGVKGDLGPEHADCFRRDLHEDLKADYVVANPPFGSTWFCDEKDVRWKYGLPPKRNANYAWVQHILYHLAPNGFASFVLTNSSASSRLSGEDDIRRAIIEADLVDCMVALPDRLFHFTPIPVCLWFVAQNKEDGRFRDRRGQTLFIDARTLGTMIDRAHRELTDEDIHRLADTYHVWRGDKDKKYKDKEYKDIPGFCKSSTLEEIQASGYVLTPGRYVGVEKMEEMKDDGEPFDEKMQRLFAELNGQFTEARKLEKAIRSTQEGLGHGR